MLNIINPTDTGFYLPYSGGTFDVEIEVDDLSVNISVTHNGEFLELLNKQVNDSTNTIVYTFHAPSNSSTDERTTPLLFFSDNGDNATINIFQEGDPNVATIALYATQLSYLSAGGTNYIQVDYINAQTINTPYCSQSWVTIQETTRGYTTVDGYPVTQVKYAITMASTTYARQVTVKFSCVGLNGNVVEESNLVLKQGSPSQLPSITPTQRSFNISCNGASGYMYVEYEYFDKATEITPTVNADWLSITYMNVSSESSNYKKIRYRYTCEENTVSTPRTATITFSGKDIYDVARTATIVVNQEGADIPPTNYIGYFTSVDGTHYSVKIITDAASDDYGTISLAGESPVVVSYNESKRLFEPVRTSTCTIKLVSDSYLMNIYSGQAHGTQVILTDLDSNKIKWCGFLQPNLYNQGYSAPIEEIELEASDCLSSLQYFEFEPEDKDNLTIVNFKNIIDKIVDKCELINYYYLTQKKFTDNNNTARDLLFSNLFISEQNFLSEENEAWKLDELLEEICKFYGLVAVQWEDSIYFIDYDEFETNKSLPANRWSKSDGWKTSNSIPISSTSKKITQESYRGSGGSMSLDDVFNRVKVNCNYYNIDNILPDLFDDELLVNRISNENGFIGHSQRYMNRGQSIILSQTYYKIYDHPNVNNLYYTKILGPPIYGLQELANPEETTKESVNIITDYVGCNIVDTVHLTKNEVDGAISDTKKYERYLLVSQLNRPWCGAEGTFHWENYNIPILEFKNLPAVVLEGGEIQPRGGAIPVTYLVLNASALFTAFLKQPWIDTSDPKGMKLKKNIGCYIYDGESSSDGITFSNINESPALCFYLRINGKWWNGSGWQTSQTYFYVPLEKLAFKDDFWVSSKEIQNNVQTNLFLGTGGYKIALPAGYISTADMYFAMGLPKRTARLSDSWGGDDDLEYGNAYCWIKDISFEIARKHQALFDDTDTIYENIVNEGSVTDDEEIELKITTDDGKNVSYSNVASKKTDGSYGVDVRFYNNKMVAMKPEEAIIERYVKQYSTPSIKETITLDLSFTPLQKITDTYWDKDFVVIGQEIDYKADCQQITLLEKK